MRRHFSVPVGVIAGFALAIMLGQTAAPAPTVGQRLSNLERRVTDLESKLQQAGKAPPGRALITRSSLSTADLAKYIGSTEAQIFADDGEFLGDLNSDFGAKSIANEVGSHGSDVASKSMWNNVGRYGGEVAALSPFNEVSARPPRLLYKGEFVCFVTVNETKTPRVHPHVLRAAVRGD
jgi:hypothetical protein